jgi:glutathione S-transferase
MAPISNGRWTARRGAGTLPPVLRVHRIPFSTNVERVALAAAHKGVEVTWVDHDPADRSAIVALSGQELVPVAETPDGVVVDSMAIVDWLEAAHPEPPLLPADPLGRARAAVFVAWFDRVWKVAPNAMDAELGAPEPDQARLDAWARELRGSLDVFEGLLAGGPFLLGDAPGVADVCAGPFLRFAVHHPPGDDERFHRILMEHLAIDPAEPRHPRLRDWIARVDALPRA